MNKSSMGEKCAPEYITCSLYIISGIRLNVKLDQTDKIFSGDIFVAENYTSHHLVFQSQGSHGFHSWNFT